MMKTYCPEKRILPIYCSDDNKVITKSLQKEFISFGDEWLINGNIYSFESKLLTDEMIQTLMNGIVPRTDIIKLITNIATTMVSHIILLSSQSITIPTKVNDIRTELFQSSSAIDQFIFDSEGV